MDNAITPHYDDAGELIGVTLHATKYSPGHPVADLWAENERLRAALKHLGELTVADPAIFVEAVLTGTSVPEALAADTATFEAWCAEEDTLKATERTMARGTLQIAALLGNDVLLTKAAAAFRKVAQS